MSWSGAAAAQEVDEAPPRPLPALPAAPPPNVVQSPDGTVSVGRTPEQGVDVHANTPSGTVHAYGCNRVDVDPRTRTALPPAPCPYAAYPVAYPVVYPQYQPTYVYPYPTPPHRKPKYAPDGARTGALIGSSLVFGVGTLAAGSAYVSSVTRDRHDHGRPALYAMGAIMTVSPSVPRYVVGDVGMGLLLTALRGGSFALGAFVDWKDESYTLPVTLAFVIPVTLGIIDLATTPHREQLEPKKPADTAKVRLQSLGPTATVDRSGALAPAVGALGTF